MAGAYSHTGCAEHPLGSPLRSALRSTGLPLVIRLLRCVLRFAQELRRRSKPSLFCLVKDGPRYRFTTQGPVLSRSSPRAS